MVVVAHRDIAREIPDREVFMSVSQQCQYALRALFELAKRREAGPVAVAEVAEIQAIPGRFLELIAARLKRAGFIESRGVQGGYTLAVSPKAVSVADIIRAIDGSSAPVKCMGEDDVTQSLRQGTMCLREPVETGQQAVAVVYEGTSLQDLIDEEQKSLVEGVYEYCI